MTRILVFFILLFVLKQVSSQKYDIIVYAATPGGLAAAITAARASPTLTIAIIEPTTYIGGMLTAGGIGLADIGLFDTSKYKNKQCKIVIYTLILYSSWFCCLRMDRN